MNKKAWAAHHKGFTIVELLIVIVVIAILAAITIVAYNGIQSRAQQSRLASESKNAATKLELFKIDNSVYPTSVTDCPTPAAANICLNPASDESYLYQRHAKGGIGSVQTNVDEGYGLTIMGSKYFLYTSSLERRSINEFVQYVDMAPMIDRYGLVKYTISFDIKSDSTVNQSTVTMYFHNGGDFRYDIGYTSIPVTTEYTHKSYTVTPSLANAGVAASWLAFFGTYGTSNIPTIKNLTIQLAQ